jgi:protein SCO1/2
MSNETPKTELTPKTKSKSPLVSGSNDAKKSKLQTPSGSKALTRMGPMLAIVAILLSVGLMFAARFYKTAHPPVAIASDQQLQEGNNKPTTNSIIQIGGPFTLIDHNSQIVTEKSYAGKYLLVFFGYTFCPDVCPTSLTTISNTLDLLDDSADKIMPLFITVDPIRDTPAHLKEYVSYFHPKLVALTGTEDQIKAVTKAYRVYFAKAQTNKDDQEDYLMDHSSITYLIGPDGNFIEHFSHGMEPEKIAERLLKQL